MEKSEKEPLLNEAEHKLDYPAWKTFLMIACYAIFTVMANAASKIVQNAYDVSTYDVAWFRSITGLVISIFTVPFFG